MTWAAFRTSQKFYRSRPPAGCRAARFAWDWLSQEGPIDSMRLVEGLWLCERPGEETLDDVDATWVRQQLELGGTPDHPWKGDHDAR
jgi:hypothetical protein